LGASAAVTLDGITPGEHEIGLSGVAGNCQVEGDNPRTVTVEPGPSASVSFAVTCADPPARAGSVRITTATTGADVDPNGYRLALDAGTAQPIGVNAVITLTNVAVGTHSVRLSELARNCGIQGSNPQSIHVSEAATEELSFSVSCGGASGTVEVRTATTGENPDPDGYTVSLDGGPAQPIGVNAIIQLAAEAVGAHQVALGGLASNCWVEGDNPRAVTVGAGATVGVAFAVSCLAPSELWTPMSSGTSKWLRSVSGSSATNVFAAGNTDACHVYLCGESSILHYDGARWTTQYTHSGGVLALWAAPDGQAFALGEGEQPAPILHYDGQRWAPMAVQPPPLSDPQSATLRAIWGTSATDVFAVGSWFDGIHVNGYAVHYDGTRWTRMDLGAVEFLRLSDVWGSSPTDVYAVGQLVPYDSPPEDDRAVILHYDGHTWSEVLRDGSVAFAYIWGTSATDVYATGSSGPNGAVWHYNGSGWSPMPIPATTPLGPIWGSSSSDIYVLGRDAGKIWHYDGSTWNRIETGSGKFLSDVWGSSATDVFAVGIDGTILKRR
jgi:hypothetical protein